MDKLDRRLDQVILQSSHFQERIQVHTYKESQFDIFKVHKVILIPD